MRRATTLALLASCALAAAHPAWADGPAPDLSVAVGIVWDDMGLPYALTFDAETELGEAAWNITDGMDLVWPHPYTVDDVEWSGTLGYAHIHLDGERHAVVAADDGIPVLVQVGEAEPYRGGDLSLIRVHGNSDRVLVLQSSFVENWETVRRQALAEHPSVPIHEVPNTWATATAYHFYGVGEPPVEVAVPGAGNRPSYEGPDPTMLVVSIDGLNHAVVNMVAGPPVLAGPMEAAALGLGDITVMEPDVCVWLDDDAPDIDSDVHVQRIEGGCHLGEGYLRPQPNDILTPNEVARAMMDTAEPFIFTIDLEYPYTWFDVEIGGPGPYAIDWGTNVQTVTGKPIHDPGNHISCNRVLGCLPVAGAPPAGEPLSPPGSFTSSHRSVYNPLGLGPSQRHIEPIIIGYEPRDRPAEIRHDFGGGWNGQVSITGNVDWVRIGHKNLASIDQWGDIRWKTMNSAFAGSPNLVHKATDMPDLSRVADMGGMFRGASSVDNISEWDVSGVTNMESMFYGVDSIGDISGWNVSQVTNMYNMFWYAHSFKQNLGNWFITLDDLTVADDDLVVGRVAPQSPSFYGRVSYEVVGPADGAFRIEPGDPVLAGPGVPLVVAPQRQVQYGFAPAVLADPAVPFVAANGTVYESLLVLDPNHNLTLGTHNVTIRSTGPLGYPSTHTAQVAVQYVAPNRPPVAWAETGLLAAPSGSVVMLNGTNSYDPDGDPLEYMWNQTGGVPVALHGTDSPYLTFTAPNVKHLNTLTFELVVNDGALDSREYTVIVLVEPARP